MGCTEDSFGFEEMYRHIDADDNLLEGEGGELIIGENFGNPLIQIERFILHVISSSEPAFVSAVNHLGKTVAVPSVIATHYLQSFNSFISAYEAGREYSEYVQLFFSVCSSMHLDHGVFQGKSHLHDINLASAI